MPQFASRDPYHLTRISKLYRFDSIPTSLPVFFLLLSLSFCNDLPEVQYLSSLSISKRWGRFYERTPRVMSSPWTPRIQKAPDMQWESPRTTLDPDRPGSGTLQLRAWGLPWVLSKYPRPREGDPWVACYSRVVCVRVFMSRSVNEIGCKKVCGWCERCVYEGSNLGVWESGAVWFNRISLTFFEGPQPPQEPL